MADPQTQTYTPPPFDTSVPDAPQAPTRAPLTNQYQSGTDAYKLNQAYIDYIGRSATPDEIQWRGARFNTTPLSQQLQDIQGSEAAQTTGRAANEVNPEVDAQIRKFYNDIATQQQQAGSQLGALGQDYAQQYGDLTFGQQQQTSALDALRAQVMQDTEYSAGQLQNKFLPAAQNAYNTANRRGMLNSSIALGLLNQGYQPITQGLTDLYRSSERQLSDADKKRQDILQKYNFDIQGLGAKESQQAKAIRDALALYTNQQQQEASAAEAGRTGAINTRSNTLQDAYRQYQLQQQQLQELIRYQTAQNQLGQGQLSLDQQKAKKAGQI